MFDRYFNYYYKRIPYVKLERRAFGGYSAERIILKNAVFGEGFRDYSAPLEDCIKRHQEMNEEAEDEDIHNFKLVLVSNDINRIRKSALIIADGFDLLSYDEEDYGFEYEDEPGSDTYSDIFEIELGRDLSDERVAGNPYILKTNVICEGTQDFRCSGFLFRGLEAGSLGDQCHAIAGVQGENVFVGITEELLDKPEIQRLILERGFDVVRLPDVTPEYYRKVAAEMIEWGEVPFASAELQETVLGTVLRKCGNHISEERISAALTLGRQRMQPGEKVFLAEHFNDLIKTEAENALDTLKGMTGLKNLKNAVREYIAVRNEMRRNPLAALECRHLVFEGNPGGGKTVGAKLLSDILAAEGITNGTFISAARKDIIGEYVGHTAPKITKLFKEAAGGVLFVDEAGFLLHRESGGYVDEAVKEFVRCMENCRDVTVIFAMYPGEAKEVLALDAGLPSRISATVRFEDYTEKELGTIFAYMLKNKGYRPVKGLPARAASYLMELKHQESGSFGNAREARRLVDAVIKAVAIRHDTEQRKPSGKAACAADLVLSADLKAAIRTMDEQKRSASVRHIGFVVSPLRKTAVKV